MPATGSKAAPRARETRSTTATKRIDNRASRRRSEAGVSEVERRLLPVRGVVRLELHIDAERPAAEHGKAVGVSDFAGDADRLEVPLFSGEPEQGDAGLHFQARQSQSTGRIENRNHDVVSVACRGRTLRRCARRIRLDPTANDLGGHNRQIDRKLPGALAVRFLLDSAGRRRCEERSGEDQSEYATHSLTRRSRNALVTTETELKAIAAPAKMGESSRPNTG